ncbi:MAG: hypothetical protein ACXV3C_12070 [Actinomycetes bacterium]
MSRSFAHNAGVMTLALLGAADVAGLAGITQDGAPPPAVVVLGAALGAVTLVAALPRYHHTRGGLLVLIGSRALSALLGIPAYFATGAPDWAPVAVSVALVLTLLGILALLPDLRQPSLSHA